MKTRTKIFHFCLESSGSETSALYDRGVGFRDEYRLAPKRFRTARACRRLEAGPEGVGSVLLLRNTHWVGVFSAAERGGVSTDLTSINEAGPDHPLRLRRLWKGPGQFGEPLHRARPALISLGA